MFCNLTQVVGYFSFLGLVPNPFPPQQTHTLLGNIHIFFPPQERRSMVANVTWNTCSSHLYSDPSLASHSTAICEGSPSSSSVLRDAVVILLYANVPFSAAQLFIYSLFIYFSFILKIPLQPGVDAKERERGSQVTVITCVELDQLHRWCGFMAPPTQEGDPPPPDLSPKLQMSRGHIFWY